MSLEETISELRSHHRFRRFAMAGQMRNDRSLEAFVRTLLGFHTGAPEKERERLSKAALAEIAKARAGTATDDAVVAAVAASDQARAPFDNLRKEHERAMGKLATSLPAYPWVESVRGFAAQGFATIVAEAAAVGAPRGLSDYPKPDKLWSRLGFAPYDGHAGSTWKRETWRPRSLTKEEWIAHPFNAQRYALLFSIGDSLMKAQRPKDKPALRYGDIYNGRRDRTAATHPEWSKMHSHLDGMRIATKQLLCDLWYEWRRALR